MNNWITVEVSYRDTETLKRDLIFPLLSRLVNKGELKRFYFYVFKSGQMVLCLDLITDAIDDFLNEKIRRPIALFLEKNRLARMRSSAIVFGLDDKHLDNSFRILQYEAPIENFGMMEYSDQHLQNLCDISASFLNLHNSLSDNKSYPDKSIVGLQFILALIGGDPQKPEGLINHLTHSIIKNIKSSEIPFPPSLAINHYAFRFNSICTSFIQTFQVKGESYLNFIETAFSGMGSKEEFEDQWYNQAVHAFRKIRNGINYFFGDDIYASAPFAHYNEYLFQLLELQEVEEAWSYFVILKYMESQHPSKAVCEIFDSVSSEQLN